jgi:cytoskeleton protein RodZ
VVSEGQFVPDHENAEATANGFGQGVGALLHASRLRCAENIENVAHMLRIRVVHLEAIEDGRFDDLPGPTYALGFVRAYADYLGLDSAEVVRRYKQELSSLTKTLDLVFPSPIPEGGAPGGAIVLVGIVVALFAYGGWYVSTSDNRFFSEVISPLPERLAALFSGAERAPPEQAAPTAPSSLSATTGETAEATPAVASPAPLPADAPEPVAEGDAVTPASDPGEASEVAGEAAGEVTVEASDDASPPTEPTEERADEAVPSVLPAPPTSAAVTVPTVSAGDEEEATAGETPGAQPSEGAPQPTEVVENAPPASSAAPSGDTPPPAEETSTETSTPGDGNSASLASNDAGEHVGTQQSEAGEQSGALPPAQELLKTPVETPIETPIKTPIETPVGAPIEAPTEAAPSVASSVPPAEGTTSRIVVRAKTASWIQVRDSVANQLLLTRLLRAGDSYMVPDRPGLQLLTGNAGALEILVDGEPVPAIGPVGAVRRRVALDTERLREGTASSE